MHSGAGQASACGDPQRSHHIGQESATDGLRLTVRHVHAVEQADVGSHAGVLHGVLVVQEKEKGDSHQIWVNLTANDAWPSDKAAPGAEDPVTKKKVTATKSG